jgi:hypothetical protein
MTQEISEIDHFTPRDLRFSLLDVVRKPSRSFADNLEKPFGCGPDRDVRCEPLERHVGRDTLDLRN